jgi:N-acetylneuraminate synthase
MAQNGSYPDAPYIEVNGRRIGPGEPTYIIAEMSGNHNGSYDRAARILEACVDAGVDAVKLQTYTADTLTINSDAEIFHVGGDNTWAGTTLHALYEEAHTPWEWQPKLKKLADDLGVDLFSSPFDFTATDFLDDMDVPAFKVASFESIDPPLVSYIASKGKPVFMSTGMASLSQIDKAVTAAREAGAGPGKLLLFKCVSSYPAPAEAMNLNTIPHLARAFNVPTGLSDHTLGTEVPLAAVALGARAIEKHVTLSRADGGVDSQFSLEPAELKGMVQQIRTIEAALGDVFYGITEWEESNKVFQRSLIITEDVKAGEVFTPKNLRSIRPGYGLSPEFIGDVIGRTAGRDIERGTPLAWALVAGAPVSS